MGEISGSHLLTSPNEPCQAGGSSVGLFKLGGHLEKSSCVPSPWPRPVAGMVGRDESYTTGTSVTWSRDLILVVKWASASMWAVDGG